MLQDSLDARSLGLPADSFRPLVRSLTAIATPGHGVPSPFMPFALWFAVGGSRLPAVEGFCSDSPPFDLGG